MNFKNVICLVFLLFILSMTAVSAADLDDDFVSGQLDDSSFLIVSDVENLENVNMIIDSEISNSPGTFDDLQFEIDNAPVGSVLNLTKDYNGHYGARINLNKNLTIDGNGHTLDCLGEGGCSAFYSTDGNIILKNLRIINGHNDYSELGGAIYSIGSAQYTLENCIFENNFANDYGGAIYQDTQKPLTIINCEFNSNRADDQHGGAIYVHSSTVSIYDSIFKANFADEIGGAIYVYSASDQQLNTIKNCQFISNRADSIGGAVCIYFGTVIVENSSFTDNYAESGGGLYGSNTIVVNSSFTDNAVDESGGAISSISLSVINSFFKSNRAYGGWVMSDGGAINSNILTIENSTFIDNYAENSGGAVSAGLLYINVNQNNSQDYNTFFINNTVEKDNGGAIEVSEYSNIVNTLFSGNTALVDGGAIRSFGDNVVLHHCLFDSNRADGASASRCWGGAICAKGNVNIDNSTFKNNYAENSGGAIYADTVSIANTPSFFEGNTAFKAKGGAIYANKFDGDVKYASFIDNSAGKGSSDDGGAIYIFNENHVTFSQNIFINNYCTDEGGAIYLDSSNSHLTLNNNIFINNHANSEGQSVYNCGYYDQINSNFWGDTNPSSNNDQLIEWKFGFWNKNVHHSDSNPLIMDVLLSNAEPVVNESTSASVVFLNPDRTSIDGEMYHGNQVSYNITPIFSSMEYKYDDKNNNYVDLVFESGGDRFIKADIGGYSVSKEFFVVDLSNNRLGGYSYNPDSLALSLDKDGNIRYLVYDGESFDTGYLNTDLDNNQSSNLSEANNDVNPSVNKQLDNNYLIYIVILLLLIALAAVLIKKYKN